MNHRDPLVNSNQNGFEQGVRHFLIQKPETLGATLKFHLNWTDETSLEALTFGTIYLNNKRLSSSGQTEPFDSDNENTLRLQLKAKDYLRVHTRPRRFQKNDFDWRARIFFQNSDFIVVDKPAGLPCHPTVDNVKENLLSYLQDSLGFKNLGVTHRLDLVTQGLLVVAKSKDFVRSFNLELAEKRVQKKYEAIVSNPPPSLGLHTHFMEPSPRAPKRVVAEARPGFARCDLILEHLERLPTGLAIESGLAEADRRKLTLFKLHIALLTGRTHQIRAQLSTLGCPILGDVAYGGLVTPNPSGDGAIQLCSSELAFEIGGEHYHFKRPLIFPL